MSMRADIKAEVKPWVTTSGRLNLKEIRVHVELKDVSTDQAVTISKFSWGWKSVEELVKELPSLLEDIWSDWCSLHHVVNTVRNELREALEKHGIGHILEVSLIAPYEDGEDYEDDC